jgi:hypothetical protein
MDEDKKILDQVNKIRSKFKTTTVDESENELSYLDELNRLIRNIFKDDPTDVYSTLSEEGLKRWKKQKLRRWLKRKLTNLNIRNILYFLLLATITCFLVSEAVGFYAEVGVVSFKTWVKAILTEVCFIFLSGYRSSGKLQAVWVNFLRAGIFTLMMFVISSQTFTIGTKSISEIDSIQQQVVVLEKQIKEKEDQMTHYKSINWPRNYTSTRIEKEKLVDKLLALQDEQARGKNKSVSSVEKVNMYGKAAFRVLLLFISVLITRRLFSF